jgi:hypothetical protein
MVVWLLLLPGIHDCPQIGREWMEKLLVARADVELQFP